MRRLARQPAVIFLVWTAASMLAACNKKREVPPDHPRVTPNVVIRDITFRSSALNRDTSYRVFIPARVPPDVKLPVVYLLHGGGGGNFHDWSNYSDVSHFAEHGLILVMPEADESYYTNSAKRPEDRYEDYLVHDLISDVEAKFPAATARASRAILGVSMGGFGAVKLALRHPELFAFAGGLSSAIDVPSRPFSIKRVGQWRHHRSILGPWGGATQRDNDPFVLARSADVDNVPYLFLTCGDQEGLLPANHNFARLLEQRRFKYEFHIVAGGHNWTQWNGNLESCFRSLLAHLAAKGA